MKRGLLISRTAADPKLPEARRQSIDEVFQDDHQVVGAPSNFSLQPKEVVVVALPEDLVMQPSEAKRTRVQMATAFLSKGHLTKDAGRYRETTFRTNAWPDGDDRKQVSETVRTGEEGTSEVITKTTSTSKPWYWDSWFAWRNERGLRLDLRDPTSLWITQLGKYDATKSRFFLRVFDIKFGDTKANVRLNNQLAEADVATYRDALKAHNKLIDQYNRERSSFDQQSQSYDSEYENRKRRNEQTLVAYKQGFANRWAGYEQQLRDWRIRNPEDRTPKEQQPPLNLPTPLPNKVPLTTPPKRQRVSDDQLNKLLQDEAVAEVQVTTLSVLAEVVDTKSGEVAWAGEFTGYTRKGVGDRVRLLETFIEKALH